MHLFMALALLAAAPAAVVLKPVANMYAQPDDATEVVSQAIYGTNIAVVESRTGWLHVRTPDDYTGWMPVTDLRRLSAGEQPYADPSVYRGRLAWVESLFANIYQEPDITKHRPLITVPFETHLEVISEPEEHPRWIQIRLADDRSGWLQRGDISFDTVAGGPAAPTPSKADSQFPLYDSEKDARSGKPPQIPATGPPGG